MISQIFRGERHLNLEQACELSAYLGFTKLEREYFLLLVQLGRAGTHTLKTVLQEQLETIKEKSEELKNRIPQDKTLTEESQAIFYSNWYYSGIRLLTSIPGYNNVDRIAERMQLPRAKVQQVLEFLLAHGLCVDENGTIKMGPQSTHLAANSPFIERKHMNWRLQGMKNMEAIEKDELFYSSPMSISPAAMTEIRAELVKLIERVAGVVRKAECEQLACLNIDWFKF